jgi:hypothetical protein
MRTSDIGTLYPALLVNGFAYLAGGLLFGIALFRARVLARWAAVLLAVGAVLSVALPALSDSAYRLLAYPHAVALIGLGRSLWRSHHAVASGDAPRALVLDAGWWTGFGLLVLAAVPVAAGATRLVELAGGPRSSRSTRASQRRPRRQSSTSPAARSTSSAASFSSPLPSDVGGPGGTSGPDGSSPCSASPSLHRHCG